MSVVGIICDYFAASTDERAASVIDLGPGAGPEGGAPPAPEPPRGWGRFRRKAEQPKEPQHGAHGEGFPTVDGKGIDPVVQMGTLEALLTGRTAEEVRASQRGLEPVAMRDEGERLVLPLTERLTGALAAASEEQLAEVALPWSQTEEFWGDGDPQVLSGFLSELAGLAHDAVERQQRLYCWVCV